MAIRQPISTPFGVDVLNAYQRVEQLRFNTKSQIAFHLRSYANESFPFIQETVYTCLFDLNGPNPIKQAYLHLKTLPEFADAVDC
jgi:hypothetical protein